MSMLQVSIPLFLTLNFPHLFFFFLETAQWNHWTTEVGTCFNWIATILCCCAILSPSSFPTSDVTFSYTDTSKMWLATSGRDEVELQMRSSWGQFSMRIKLLWPRGATGSTYLMVFVAEEVTVEQRTILPLKVLSSFQVLQKLSEQGHFWDTWLCTARFLIFCVIKLMWTQHGNTSLSSSNDSYLSSFPEGKSGASEWAKLYIFPSPTIRQQGFGKCSYMLFLGCRRPLGAAVRVSMFTACAAHSIKPENKRVH